MEETLVQEIANQLGMAVEEGAAFFQSVLPAYIDYKIYTCLCLIIASAIIFIGFLIATTMFIKQAKKPKLLNQQREDYWFAAFVCGALTIISLVVCVISFCNCLGWVFFF